MRQQIRENLDDLIIDHFVSHIICLTAINMCSQLPLFAFDVPKTKVMVLSAVPAPAVGFTCNGNPVEQ